ncbi:hypothetical protein Ccrd_024618 [Cynara cardunculus var. scolymus]|uniref:Uncharacterized protein n=1 Tax=Cynara cardunculus var. scolymus TaxID=59895 RepID=A0A103XC43_CYNCS|nr:hypothetical protein Ccrd_024618 [Cynara cardunculus var. scolymus]
MAAGTTAASSKVPADSRRISHAMVGCTSRHRRRVSQTSPANNSHRTPTGSSQLLGCSVHRLLPRRHNRPATTGPLNRGKRHRHTARRQFNLLHSWIELRDQEKWTRQRERLVEVDLVEDRG